MCPIYYPPISIFAGSDCFLMIFFLNIMSHISELVSNKGINNRGTACFKNVYNISKTAYSLVNFGNSHQDDTSNSSFPILACTNKGLYTFSGWNTLDLCVWNSVLEPQSLNFKTQHLSVMIFAFLPLFNRAFIKDLPLLFLRHDLFCC